MATTDLTPYEDLHIASMDYWCGLTGQDHPPQPSYRSIGGKTVLGRYMGPYDCQANMAAAKNKWQSWMVGFFAIGGMSLLFGEWDWLLVLVAAPILIGVYLTVRHRNFAKYFRYYKVLGVIQATGQPQWVPYDKHRLAAMKTDATAMWP